MPAFHRKRYYVHHDLEELQGLNQSACALLVQAKPIPRSHNPRQTLPKLPPLYHYPKPVQSTSDSASFASTDWMTRSEPSSERKAASNNGDSRVRRTKPATARSLPTLPSSSASSRRVTSHKEALKVNFVSASDLQDLLRDTRRDNKHVRHSSRVLPPLEDLESLGERIHSSSYAWSHRPLIKYNNRLAQVGDGLLDSGSQQGYVASFLSPRRSHAFTTKDGHLEGKNAAHLDFKPARRTVSPAEPSYMTGEPNDYLNDDDDDLDSASVLGGIGSAEEDMLFRRERVKRGLITNALETLKRYDGRHPDPLSSLPSIKLNRRQNPDNAVKTHVVGRLPLDSIPEGENEPKDEQLSDDGASSWSSGSGSSRRRLMNLTTPWRPKSPALAKPGLAMIPENDNNVTLVSNNTKGCTTPQVGTSATCQEGKVPDIGEAVFYDYTKHQRVTYRGRPIRPKGAPVSPPIQTKNYDSHKQEKPKSNTRIQQFRDELTSKQKPRRVKFLKS